MHQQQHYTLFKMKKVKLQSTTPGMPFKGADITIWWFKYQSWL